MDSFEIRDTKNQIINFLNTKSFPLEVKRLICADILTELTNIANEEISEIIKAKESENAEGAQ